MNQNNTDTVHNLVLSKVIQCMGFFFVCVSLEDKGIFIFLLKNNLCAPELSSLLLPAWYVLTPGLKNHTCTMSSSYRLTNWHNLSHGQCERLWKEKQTPWPQKLRRWAPPSITHLSQNGGCGYQICLASFRTSFNSTFSGSPAFNESFAPVLLYQDSRKVRHPRAIMLDNDIANTYCY